MNYETDISFTSDSFSSGPPGMFPEILRTPHKIYDITDLFKGFVEIDAPELQF